MCVCGRRRKAEKGGWRYFFSGKMEGNRKREFYISVEQRKGRTLFGNLWMNECENFYQSLTFAFFFHFFSLPLSLSPTQLSFFSWILLPFLGKERGKGSEFHVFPLFFSLSCCMFDSVRNSISILNGHIGIIIT